MKTGWIRLNKQLREFLEAFIELRFYRTDRRDIGMCELPALELASHLAIMLVHAPLICISA
jgi:hypothetical protein